MSLIVESRLGLGIEHVSGTTCTDSKSKSSIPNLLYLISTFRYMIGMSCFVLPLRIVFAKSSCMSEICCSVVASFSISLAFSLKNFGTAIELPLDSMVRRFSA